MKAVPSRDWQLDKGQRIMEYGSNNTVSSQEMALLDLAKRLERYREGRHAVHVHLSQLKPENRRNHHLRVAHSTVLNNFAGSDGQAFLLGNTDLVFVSKDLTLEKLDDVIMQLRHLFSDDPLVIAAGEHESGHGQFATIYNLEKQYPAFLELCKLTAADEQDRKRRLSDMAAQAGDDFSDGRHPLTTGQLARLEDFLERTEITNVMKRQPVCAIVGKEPPKPIFKELYVSIMDLAASMLPNVNLASNRWLFQHLTQILDKRMLSRLSKARDSTLHSHFSINLNVNTLLEPEFLAFDNSLHAGSRETLVIELQFIDILADMSMYQFARDFVKERGYRVCVDGVYPDALPFIDRKLLGADMIKVFADDTFSADCPADRREETAKEVERQGKGRIILARCDSRAIISAGQEMGITVFQGHYIDMALKQLAKLSAATKDQKQA